MFSKHDLMRLLKIINYAFLGLNNIVHMKRQRTTIMIHVFKQQFSVFLEIRVGEKVCENTCNIV